VSTPPVPAAARDAGWTRTTGPATPERFGWAQLRLALAAPRPAAGLTSEWRLVDGIRTHCRRSGTVANGRVPVLLVHGLAVSHRYLTPLATALASTHPVYVPDLPGFGLSNPPPQPYDAARHAAHLAAWLAAYELGPVCVLGHSFGAEVAAALAARHPDAVQAVVLAGPTSDPAARSRWGQVRRFLVDLTREAALQAPVLFRDIRDAGPHRVHATLAHSVHNPVERDLARITVPTLVVTGGRDPIVPRAWRDTVAGLVPAAAPVSVPGAAHNVATTAPARVADEVRAFLAQLPLPDPKVDSHAHR
jgi:pimeloyl-ACP methyl ester carboxylesterase